jgi:hypothetical protein
MRARRAAVLVAAILLAGCPRDIVVLGEDTGQRRDSGVRQDAGAADALGPDALDSDASAPDANILDANALDATASDASALDAIADDAEAPDALELDAAGFDALAEDALPPDAGFMDAAPYDGGALSPLLMVPDAGEPVCTIVGSESECPFLDVCRFFDGTQGRCETCSPCNGRDQPCSQSSECDILFACYDGFCTNFCDLGTQECGSVQDCINVGHPTKGVCRPGI